METIHSPEVEDRNPPAARVVTPVVASTPSAEGGVTAGLGAPNPSPLERIRNVLRPALHSRPGIDWESLKQRQDYAESEPPPPRYAEYPPEPNADDPCYKPPTHYANGALDPSVEQRRREGYERYIRDYAAWAEKVKKIEAENERLYQAGVAAVREWSGRYRQHRQSQIQHNETIERRKADYLALLASAVEDYCRQILSASHLPEPLSRAFELQYFPESRTLLIEHTLPLPQDLPRVRGTKNVKSRGQHVDIRLSDTQLGPVYADVVYQICLRTLHELFAADVAQGLDWVVFNGWVEVPDPGAVDRKRCVLSVRADKQQLGALNLLEMDAKACFKALKGVARAKLHSLEAVTPLMARMPS